MQKYVCVHGHFYQPPRENPWLETIELQESAYPYHDWNERITAECYGPNATSRILDAEGRIAKIVNNYSRMSFDFGPTLMHWLEKHSPAVYATIIEADRISRELFGGHGSAIAQAFNHMIMPLANRRDKITQIKWGIHDFKRRFGRDPEGMWLPETAADVESLEIMAFLGIKFTLLAPHQAARTRKKGSAEWHDANGGIDTSVPYEAVLPSGNKINVFFYNGGPSAAVAFEGLLKNGEKFASRLLESFPAGAKGPRLVSIATDGETYGHHHRFGNMALAYALNHVEENKLAKIANYGQFLEIRPPEDEVEIAEDTSWSCAHGIERWRGNCGCSTGAGPGWNQEWRGPLREALDWLRDGIAAPFEEKAGEFLKDAWAARDDYIRVVLDRSREAIEAFFSDHAKRHLKKEEQVQALKLLEMQRNAMLMYTSCGWFFADISGIETVQVLNYAGRAVRLATEMFERNYEFSFAERLEAAKSNLPYMRNGRMIFENSVASSEVTLEKVCAHFAISSVFSEKVEDPQVYCYTVTPEEFEMWKAGRASLIMGGANVVSDVTWERGDFTFGALHFGDHNLQCGVREHLGPEVFEEMKKSLGAIFNSGDLPSTIRELDKYLGSSVYSLKSLFKDEQRKILESLLKSTLDDTEAIYRQIYENNAPLMRFISEMKVPPPNALRTAAEFVINSDLKRLFGGRRSDWERGAALLAEARQEQVTLDSAGIGYEATQALERLMAELRAAPGELAVLEEVKAAVEFSMSLPFEVGIREPQNGVYAMAESDYPGLKQAAEAGDETARKWVETFRALCEKLRVLVH